MPAEVSVTKPNTAPPSTPSSKGKPLPLSLQWVDPHLAELERLITSLPTASLLQWAIPAVKSYGILNPAQAVGDVEAFSHKIKRALMTDGNTRLRAPIRTLLTFFMLNGPFSLDPSLLLQVAVKVAVVEALEGVASAQINTLAAKEEGDAG